VGSPRSGACVIDVPAAVFQVEARHGPIPSAAEMARYRDVYADAPRILLAELQAEGRHRRARETEMVRAAIASERRGQHYALAVVVIAAAAGVAFAGFGHPAIGGGIVGCDLLGAAGMFVYGRYERRREMRALEEMGDSGG
jgi:uncharacterized membrane protein